MASLSASWPISIPLRTTMEIAMADASLLAMTMGWPGIRRAMSSCDHARFEPETTAMKLPKFDYASPTTVQEAVALLAAGNGTAKLLAGGQSLVPVLAFRLAAPSMLVDLGRIAGLDTIEIDDCRRSPRRTGPLVRHRGGRTSHDRASAACRRHHACCALPDPQARHRRRQPGACRSGRRDARHRGRLRCRTHACRSVRQPVGSGGGVLPRAAHHRAGT